MAVHLLMPLLLAVRSSEFPTKLSGNKYSHCYPRDTTFQPPVVHCILTFAEVDFSTPDFTARTRGYQPDDDASDATPMGPTIHVWPGDTLKIDLYNNLTQPMVNTSGIHNSFHDFPVTNVHTHGLHIGGEIPADSVFVEVKPGGVFQYTYNLPQDHMPGTHWYHPHKHGSTAIQAGGGGVGMLIVRDPPGTLPRFLERGEGEGPVPEVELVILGLTLDNNKNYAAANVACCKAYNNLSMDYATLLNVSSVPPPDPPGPCQSPGALQKNVIEHIWERDRNNLILANSARESNGEPPIDVNEACEATKIWDFQRSRTDIILGPDADHDNIFLVNGEHHPKISIAADGWVRFRILYANIEDQLYFSMPDGCEMQVIAKDGIYLKDAPRRTSYAFFGSGNRADILVRCTKGGKSGQKKTCAVHENGVNTHKECWEYSITAWYYKTAGCGNDCPELDNSNDVCYGVYDLKKGASAEEITDIMRSVNEALAPDKRATFVNLGTILAIDEAAVQQCDLPSFKVNYPCYLADLTNVTEEQLSQQAGYQSNRHLHFGIANSTAGYPAGFPSINGQFYGSSGFARHDEPNPNDIGSSHHVLKPKREYSMPVGSLQSFEILGVNFHAYHWHVNPFQLQVDYDEFGFPSGTELPPDRDWAQGQNTNADRPKAFESEDGNGFQNYFKKGDWADVLQIPPKWCAPVSDTSCVGASRTGTSPANCTPKNYAQFNASFPIRTNLDRFASRQVVHCHILNHEDWGMMTLLDMQPYDKWAEDWSSPGMSFNPGDKDGHNLLAYGKQLGKCYGPGPANVPNTGDWRHHSDWGKTNMCCMSNDDCKGSASCVDGTGAPCGVTTSYQNQFGRNLLFSSLPPEPEDVVTPNLQVLASRNCKCSHNP